MAIPPFPSQDLAKLVLGYLAEEQLMTAYDEFLQASPYLDAMRNEYDRIFMTSLKNILAEYRAVKIYVETCKPLTLRRKLFKCVNLLEIVKYLINNIDSNKLLIQDNVEKNSLEKSSNTFQTTQCEICNSLKLPNCVCKGQPNNQNTLSNENASQAEQSTLQNSTEATPLADLPGNFGKVGKKPGKKTSKKNISNVPTLQSNVTDAQNDQSVKQPKSAKNTLGHTKVVNCSKVCLNSNVLPTCVTGMVPNIPECCNTHLANNTPGGNRYNNVLDNKGVSSASTFQEFASGVQGSESRCATVPDSSTSENIVFQTPTVNNDLSKPRETPRSQIVYKMESINKNIHPPVKSSVATVCATYSRIRPKAEEQRIRILSDIKVDNAINSNERRLIPTLRNATSTPLMRMQTLVINGTPAYRPHPVNMQQSFTKDEIMAMPTIIVVPASDPSRSSTNTKSTMPQNSNVITVPTNHTGRLLSPLTVDVSSNSSEENNNKEETIKEVTSAANEVGLIKPVEVPIQPKMTSVPKDAVTTCTAETSTPMVLPPVRKSSSTPRRTSHVRVLDFTTPRRVLHETTIEEEAVQPSTKPDDVALSKNMNKIFSEQVDFALNENNKQIANVMNLTVKPPVNTEKVPIKKGNWDDDLRAMIAQDEEVLPKAKNKARLKTTKKKKDVKKKTGEKNEKSDVPEKHKSRKSKRKLEEEEEEVDLTIKPDAIPVKPTINIKPAADRGAVTKTTKKEIENCNVKSSDEERKQNEERTDTPEVDRISLQNVIGAKLNISDLLETPYKQVFYDIQMETPRCLGPDMPDEPMSDIKIMNIPTPRFFDSPKITQATPSSYSSRPTDYSSGGSYYKPDDQDYLPIPDIRCPITLTKEQTNVDLIKGESNGKKSTRPVRQCAKNVSYYSSNKIKDDDDKTDISSICSDTVNTDKTHDRVVVDKQTKVNKTNETTKVEKSKRGNKKKKSPALKEKPKTFMKIKPRRITPTKENLSGRSRKRTLQCSSPKLPRKRTTSKDKNVNVTAVITSVPPKSRRKSSTPRKLHCSKTFNSESSGHNSPETLSDRKQQNITRDTNSINTQDSDTEQLNLRWSDDGSQDGKACEVQKKDNESEDISQIQEYIKTTVVEEEIKEVNTVLQTQLVKRQFDEDTAKNIAKDLMDTPPRNQFQQVMHQTILEPKSQTMHEIILSDKSIDTDSSINNELQIAPDIEGDDDEIELSVHESNEESDNWYSLAFKDDEAKYSCQQSTVKLKDTFSMEVCIEDGIAIRLRATPFNCLFDMEAGHEDQFICDKEMRDAVASISNIEKLYTPLKDSIKAQCYEIFDSTLTSLDTPLKVSSPRRLCHEITTTQIILEEESNSIDNSEFKKRKRLQISSSSDDSVNDNKKLKSDPEKFFGSANIQNIDIESVLEKLHGP